MVRALQHRHPRMSDGAPAYDWSPWVPFPDAVVCGGSTAATTSSGLYRARRADTQDVVYVGCAGIRTSQGDYGGIFGRLTMYRNGTLTGLAENALTLALIDPE